MFILKVYLDLKEKLYMAKNPNTQLEVIYLFKSANGGNQTSLNKKSY